MKKRSLLLLISMLLGIGYMIYSAFYWFSASQTDVSGTIASVIVLPHLILAFIGVVFNIIGYFLNNRWFGLVGAILYTVSILFMPFYFIFVIIELILSYIAFYKMTKTDSSNTKPKESNVEVEYVEKIIPQESIKVNSNKKQQYYTFNPIMDRVMLLLIVFCAVGTLVLMGLLLLTLNK